MVLISIQIDWMSEYPLLQAAQALETWCLFGAGMLLIEIWMRLKDAMDARIGLSMRVLMRGRWMGMRGCVGCGCQCEAGGCGGCGCDSGQCDDAMMRGCGCECGCVAGVDETAAVVVDGGVDAGVDVVA